jgi:hypothetical protein
VNLTASGLWALFVFLYYQVHGHLAGPDDQDYLRRERMRRRIRHQMLGDVPIRDAFDDYLSAHVWATTAGREIDEPLFGSLFDEVFADPELDGLWDELMAAGTTSKGVDFLGEETCRGLARLMADATGQKLIEP